MADNNFTEMRQVQQYYTERLLQNIKNIGGNPIIWHDPIEFGVVVRELFFLCTGNMIIPLWSSYFSQIRMF